MNKKRVLTLGVVILILAGLVLSVVNGVKKRQIAREKAASTQALQESARPVEMEVVRAESLTESRSYPGVIQASEESELSFRVGGPLLQVNVTEGMPVRRGDLLMQIDPRDFEDRIQSIEAQLAGAQALQERAELDYRRAATLYADKVISDSEHDAAKSSRNSADAAVKSLKVQLQIARHSLEDTSLKAPYDGRVSEQLVENHEMIKSGDVVMHFHNIRVLEVVVHIPENEIIHLPLDGTMSAVVTFPAVPGKRVEAELTEWNSAADPLTRTYEATFRFNAPDDFLVLPGMSASISWSLAAAVSTLTVPVSALCPASGGGNSVWVYDDASGNAVCRPVLTGDLSGPSRITVIDGLSEGERVVVSGSRLIHSNLALAHSE